MRSQHLEAAVVLCCKKGTSPGMGEGEGEGECEGDRQGERDKDASQLNIMESLGEG